jgi:hypothetical protein
MITAPTEMKLAVMSPDDLHGEQRPRLNVTSRTHCRHQFSGSVQQYIDYGVALKM